MFRYHRKYVAFAVAILGMVSSTSSIAAQTRDPIAEARTIFEARQPASTAAGVLKREHTRTLEQSATILRTVGFTARAIVPALRSEYSPSLTALYGSLKDAGFASRDISEGFASSAIALDCIDPQGYAIPCGSFGGMADAAVTGQVSWNPKPEGEVNETLSITASDLPPVFVRIGSVTLNEVNSSNSSVIVRLPATPVTGPLRIIRKSDNVSGLLQNDYRVVTAPLPWTTFAAAATEGAVADMKRWMSGASIASGCVVNGALAVAPIGHFTSTTGFAGAVRTKLIAAGAAPALADSWDTAFRMAFSSYTANVTVPALPLYPALVAWPGAHAPPLSGVSTPLALFASVGVTAMQPQTLSAALVTAIASASPAGAGRDAAAYSFSNTVSARFSLMLAQSLVVGLKGGGPVPQFNPPAVTVAPVAGGSCSGTNIVVVPPHVW